MASEIRVNKIENRSGLGTVTFADTGVDLAGIVTATTFSGSGASLTNLPAANVTGTLPAISGANLTNLPAANLTGALPAISGANLTGIAATDNVRTGILDVAGIATFRNNVNVGTAVTITESGIEATGVGITVANINGGSIGGRRNKIINGEFRVNQRNHSGSASHNSYTLDRWKYARSANTEFSTSQSTDTPDGFANSVKLDCIGANGSTGSTDYAYFRYHIEGQDLQDLNKGTSAAKVATLSFYVKCDITGTFAINVVDQNNRMCNLTYTVSDTNWNRYIVTIPADTSGAIANTNVTGLSVHFYIIAGSNITSGGSLNSWGAYDTGYLAQGHTANIVSTDHNWYMTGVQLEVGSQATAFEHRTVAEELLLCQRYYYKHVDGNNKDIATGCYYRSDLVAFSVKFPVSMRTAPTLDYVGNTNAYTAYSNNSSDPFTGMGIVRSHVNTAAIDTSTGTSGTQGHGCVVATETSGDGYMAFSAEL